jgi:hypothetical protein
LDGQCPPKRNLGFGGLVVQSLHYGEAVKGGAKLQMIGSESLFLDCKGSMEHGFCVGETVCTPEHLTQTDKGTRNTRIIGLARALIDL